jgi:hypothetical protein
MKSIFNTTVHNDDAIYEFQNQKIQQMSKKLILMLCFIPFICIGQATEKNERKNYIGLSSGTWVNGYEGYLRYEYALSDKKRLGVQIGYNSYYFLSFTVDYKYRLLQSKRFSFYSGIDLTLRNYNYYPETKYNYYLDVKIPLEFRYRIANNYNLTLTYAPIIATTLPNITGGPLNNLRLGMLYRFK